MVPDYGEGIVMLYLLFICTTAALPIGMIAGILTAVFMRESALLGLALGLLSGFLGVAFSVFMVWLNLRIDFNLSLSDNLFLFMLLAPSTIAAALPVVPLWFRQRQQPNRTPG